MSDDPAPGILVGTLLVTMWLDRDGQAIVTTDVDPEDPQTFPVVTQLGMLDLARDTLLHPPDDA